MKKASPTKRMRPKASATTTAKTPAKTAAASWLATCAHLVRTKA